MKLIAFSLENYRSIRSTPRLSLSNFTVLVGPNNEGKSNLLSALVCALSLAQEVRLGLRRLGARAQYHFERDFPVDLQGKEEPPKTKFLLEFELDAEDKIAFHEKVGSRLNGTLRIQFTVGKNVDAAFAVKIQGRAQQRLTAKRNEIAQFVASRLQFQYIGALRSEEQSREIVESMVSRAMFALENDVDYQKAVKQLEDLEAPLLQAVAATVHQSLKPFLPTLRGVHTSINKEQRYRAFRRLVEISLDDGSLTPLSQKGDGVKSLVAIALAKAAAEISAGSKTLILAIEEPEAHLHSGAIHSLKALLEQIAEHRQVIISTHEPALVRRDSIADNVIIEDNQARAASSLEELRAVLGVQLGENLVSPDLVVLVEGPNDEELLKTFAIAKQPEIQNAIISGRLKFLALNGAGNLSHQLRFHRSMVCEAIAFLDDDQEGNAAFDRAKADGLVSATDVFLSNRPGTSESELEDLIDPGIYETSLLAFLGISTLRPRGRAAKKANWSARLRAVLIEGGRPRSELDALITRAKGHISQIARSRADTCLIPGLSAPIDNLVRLIENKLCV